MNEAIDCIFGVLNGARLSSELDVLPEQRYGHGIWVLRMYDDYKGSYK